jgi:hypothetical protein
MYFNGWFPGEFNFCKYVFIVVLQQQQKDLGWTTFSNKNSTGADFSLPPLDQH